MAYINGLMRLGRDAELRYLPDGTPVANLALAFNYGQKDAEGKRASQWIDASLWGKRAEGLAPHLKKGDAIDVILSDPHSETYQGKEGPRSKLVARVLEIEFAGGGRSENSGSGVPTHQQRAEAPPKRQPAAGGFADMDDDIPF